MSVKSFAAGTVVGAIGFSAVAAWAGVQVVGGVVGVTRGYGNATAVCVEDNGELLNGSKIEPITMPISDGRGRTAVGVTFRCF